MNQRLVSAKPFIDLRRKIAKVKSEGQNSPGLGPGTALTRPLSQGETPPALRDQQDHSRFAPQ